MSLCIVGYVALYLLVGAVINGVASIDPEEAEYYEVLLFWPVVLAFVVLIVISTIVSKITNAIKKGIHG